MNGKLGELEALVSRYPEMDWEALLKWNRTHKPGNLVHRSLAQFLKGAEYSLNDLASHDKSKCPKCKPKGGHAGISCFSVCQQPAGALRRFHV
ncbi:MAG TPA: hypothetical protein VMJ93_04290 [Verrucomicrobiae bacterium]|nr:hypothetical protein [Verrucomicrobiae bacterium]